MLVFRFQVSGFRKAELTPGVCFIPTRDGIFYKKYPDAGIRVSLTMARLSVATTYMKCDMISNYKVNPKAAFWPQPNQCFPLLLRIRRDLRPVSGFRFHIFGFADT